MPELEDKQLEKEKIEACQQGDQDAFEFLYQKYHRGLYGYLLSILKSTHAAEDLTQDVFIKLFTHITTYRFQSPFAHWLFRLAHNAAIDHLRREKIRFAVSLDKEDEDQHPLRERIEGKTPAPSLQSEQDETAGQVREAVDELPESFRTVVILREWEDLSYEEIGERLNISTGTIKSRLFRARGILAKKLKHIM
jgi:RNA polymerase sigma-70 factor, ECF subfamily